MKPMELEVINQAGKFGIKNKLELAHMLARFSVETGDFERLSESLNYSAEALVKMFPKRVTPELANKIGRTKEHPADQVAIANLVYGTRMGNENDGTNDNDGYEYRGGGLTQLTGQGMYLSFLNWLHSQGFNLNLTLNTIADWVRTPDGAIISAIWFWLDRRCGIYARKDDVVGVCKAINGGYNGLKEQEVELAKYKGILQV